MADVRKGVMARMLLGDVENTWGTRPSDYDADYVTRNLPLLDRWFGDRGWLGTEFAGWEHFPDAPVMLIGNHSGGTITPDVYGLTAGWYRHFGSSRPIHSMSHEMVFAIPKLAHVAAQMGVLRAHPERGRRVLTEFQRDLLVMPGGDVDVWRPYRDRYKVTFAGRKGYARLAIETGVPIVPMAQAGAHSTLVVLSDGKSIAHALGLHERFRSDVFPIHLSLPFGLNIGPWPHLPLPVTLRYRFGEAIYPEATEATPAAIDALDDRVQAAVQRELDVLQRQARPLGGRIRRGLRRVAGQVFR